MNGTNLLNDVEHSLQKRLGTFADVWMDAKIESMRKLGHQLAVETDPEKLKELRAQVNDVLVSDTEIEAVIAKFNKLLDMARSNVEKLIAIREMVRKEGRGTH